MSWDGMAGGAEVRQAAILIIGDEILSGEVCDENAAYLARRLTALGLQVRSIGVVPDRPEAVARAINEARAEAALVFVTGGIGPTHDDVTRQAVAVAFGVECVRHPEAEERLRAGYGALITEAELGMADLPAGSRLLTGMRFGAFGFRLGAVHVLPGIPALLRDIFERLVGDWEPADYYSEEIVTRLREGNLADGLRAIQGEFPAVAIGSYPVKTEEGYRVRIVLRARDRIAIAIARARVEGLVAAAEGAVRQPEA